MSKFLESGGRPNVSTFLLIRNKENKFPENFNLKIACVTVYACIYS